MYVVTIAETVVLTSPVAYIKSADGQKAQKMLWNETVDEMSKLITVPDWMSKV